MATVIEVMAKLNGNASSMVSAFNDAKKAGQDHSTSTKASSESASGALMGLAAKATAALGGVALAYSAAQGAMEQRANASNFVSKMGISPEQAGEAAKVAGSIYSANWGESLGEVTDATVKVGQALGGVTDKARLSALTVDALAFSKAFGVDTVDSLNAAQTMVKTGLSPSIEEAYNVMAAGAQKGLNANGDLFETLNEYGTQFQKVGIDGAQAMGLIQQGMKAGARDTDYISDAIKEFTIRAIDGSKLTGEGFQALGMDAGEAAATIAAGGPAANEALATVLDKLRSMTDPAAKAAAATALFGTKAEDLGQALFALDPRTAAAGMGDLAGSMDKVKQGVAGASTPLENFQRSFETAISSIGVAFLPAIDYAASFGEDFFNAMHEVGPAITEVGGFITGTLVPALQEGVQWMSENQGIVIAVAGTIGAVMLPVLVRLAVGATISAAAQVAAWATSGAGAVKAGIMYVVTSYQIIGSWVAQGAAAIASGAITVAIWALYAAEAIKGAAVSVANAARVVGGWVLMGVQSMIQAAKMAAAWFIALGPVGWVIAIVIGLVALVIANWEAVSTWTAQAWNNIVGFVVAAWEAIVSWVSGAIANVVNPIVDGFNGMASLISDIFTNIGNFVSGVWNWIFNLLTAIGQAFWAEHGAQLTAAWNFIVAVFTGVLNFYIGIWTAIFTFIVGAVTNIVNGISAGFTAAVGWITSTAGAIWAVIVSVFTAVWGFVTTIFGAIGAGIAAAWNWYVGIITGVLSAIWGVVSSVFNSVWGFISGIFNTIAGFLAGVWNTIYSTVSGAVSRVWQAVSSGFNQVWGTVASIFGMIAGFIGGVWNGIISGAQSIIGQVGGAFSGIWGAVTGALAGAGGWLVGAGRNIVQGLINGVQALAGTIGNAFLSMVPGWIVGPFKAALGIASPSKLFTKFGKWIIQGLGIGVNSEEQTATDAMTKAARAVEDAGSGITIAAPRIAIPEVPNIAAQLALPALTQDIMLNFVGTSPVEAIKQFDAQLKADRGAYAGGDAYNMAAVGGGTTLLAPQQAPVIEMTVMVENPWGEGYLEAKVIQTAEGVTNDKLTKAGRAARGSRGSVGGGY